MPYPGSQPYDSSFNSKDSTSDHFMFTSQPEYAQRSLYQTTASDSPKSWPPYDQASLPPFQSQPLLYRGFPTPAPYPAPRLSSLHNIAGATNMSRLSLAGSPDPTTGIFYRTPEHPRLRTAQACEKCRTRKTKCSGEHPSCKRCIYRGFVCEYAKEGRVRGQNKTKTGTSTGNSSLNDQHATALSANRSVCSVEQAASLSYGGRSKTRDSSISCEESSPVSPSITRPDALHMHSPSGTNFTPMSQRPSLCTNVLSQELYSLSTSTFLTQSSGRNSLSAIGTGLGEHRISRPRPPNLGLGVASHWRQDVIDVGDSQTGWVNQPNVELGLSNLGAELGMEVQGSQRQYDGQRLAQQQRTRYLQAQQRYDLQQQQQHTLQHQRNVPNCLEYPQVLQQPPSYSPLSIQQQQDVNAGVSVYYTPIGEYSHQGGLHSLQARDYQEQYVSSVMGHGRSYQEVPTGMERAEQGLHPSLSRIEKRAEPFSSEDPRAESATRDCPSNGNRGAGVIEENEGGAK